MNIPSTQKLLVKEIKSIINKFTHVMPQIPDKEYQGEQEKMINQMKKDFEKHEYDSTELKRLLIRSKSSVFNFHLKFPQLKAQFDKASKSKPIQQESRETFDKIDERELRKRQVELKMKNIKSAYDDHLDDEDDEEEAKRKKDKFIGKCILQSPSLPNILWR